MLSHHSEQPLDRIPALGKSVMTPRMCLFIRTGCSDKLLCPDLQNYFRVDIMKHTNKFYRRGDQVGVLASFRGYHTFPML